MKIVVLNGTEIKGCTFNMKELFLSAVGNSNEVKEFYFPKDCPNFCLGCKQCFYSDITHCPHREYTIPIWESILWADLIVVTSPSYCFGATAQIKAVLDHFGTKWMAHSPERQIFKKQAVIITNSIGAGMDNVVKVVGKSLSFWGVSKIYVVKQALFGTDWENIAEKRKKNIARQCNLAAKKAVRKCGRVKPSLKIKFMFSMMKTAQRMIHKSEIKKGHSETKDHRYWSEQGWLNGKKPWKDEK